MPRTGRPKGRPRDPNVPTTAMDCPTHGLVDARIHKNGHTRNGSVRLRTRCPQCHAEAAKPQPTPENSRHDYEPGESTHPMHTDTLCATCGQPSRSPVHGSR